MHYVIASSGVGKSHIIQAVGQKACVRGYRVMYRTSADLLADLTASLADKTLPARLRRYASPDLLCGFRSKWGSESTESGAGFRLMWGRIPVGSGALFQLERNRAPVTGIVPHITGIAISGVGAKGRW